MDLGLKNKVALVLAAGGGLGERIAGTLAEEGVRVCLSDVDGTALEAATAAITKAGGTAKAFAADLSDLCADEESDSRRER